MAAISNLAHDFTLVIDVGKTHAKLLAFDGDGTLVSSETRPNAGVDSGLGYTALDVDGVAQWLWQRIAALPQRHRVGHIVPITHGAAFCGLDDAGLVFPPMDYEWDGYGELRARYQNDEAMRQATGTPHLPLGLNAELQLFWLIRTYPRCAARVRTWLPYPQYWAWRLCGVRASEVSSLGCHTHLWAPAVGFSDFATRHGIAQRFAPLRRAWQSLGRIEPALASRLGLPAQCEVICGAHDSNACLATHLLHPRPVALVTTGTWTVVMAPGADTRRLDLALDMLLNVAVDGQSVPTARFMGGREFASLCAGAAPAAAGLADLQAVLESRTVAWPAFARAGGPFRNRAGWISRATRPLAEGPLALPAGERVALAALYTAQMTQWAIERLAPGREVVVEGPFARNTLFLRVLASLRPGQPVLVVDDDCEASARGAWMLAHWDLSRSWPAPVRVVEALPAPLADLLREQHRQWLAGLRAAPSTADDRTTVRFNGSG